MTASHPTGQRRGDGTVWLLLGRSGSDGVVARLSRASYVESVMKCVFPQRTDGVRRPDIDRYVASIQARRLHGLVDVRLSVGLAVAAVLMSGWAVPIVSARSVRARHIPKPPATVVLHPRFRVVARRAVSVSSDGRRVVISAVGVATTLINEQTGKRSTLHLSAVTRPAPVSGRLESGG